MSLTEEYRRLEILMVQDGVGTKEEIDGIKVGYHDFATRADFAIVNRVMKARLGVEMNLEPEKTPGAYQFIEFYTKIPEAINAQVVVETGTGAGGSCDAFVSAMQVTGGRLYSVDNYPDHISIEICKERHLSQGHPVTFIIGDSIESAKRWTRGPIDVLYLDSGHTFGFVKDELEAWGRHHPKIILVHDTLEGDAGTQGTPVLPTTVQSPYWCCKLYARKHDRVFVNVGCCFTGLGVII